MELVSGMWLVDGRPSLRFDVCLKVLVDDTEDRTEGDLELMSPVGLELVAAAELIRLVVRWPDIALDLLWSRVVAGGILDAICDILVVLATGNFTDAAGGSPVIELPFVDT